MQLIGRTLGQYRVTEKIGQGGMAAVYKAYQPSLDRYVAVKVLAPQHAHTPGFKERFFREARAVAMLSHPNILPIYDLGMENDISYIVMKYIAGHCMRDILGQQMALGRASHFIHQIAGALDHAHDHGIIHRDIKSANLLMEGEWVLIADFGIAKIVEGSTALTSTGETMGTPAYMSPEQASGKPVNHYTDIYSLGIVLYEMLTGQVPFKGETPYGVMFKHVNDPLPLPRIHRPNIPERVERIILKALAKIPEHRYSRAGELAEALRGCAEMEARETGPQPEPVARPFQVQDAPPSQPHMEMPPASALTPSQAPAPLSEGDAVPPRRTRTSSSKTLVITMVILLAVVGIGGTLIYLGPLTPPRGEPPKVGTSPPGATIQELAVLKAISTPSEAEVYVDGVSKGKTPLELNLPLKEYTVRMALSGYQEWKDNVRLVEAREYPLNVDLKKEVKLAWLKIEPKPAGADVYLNDHLQGKSPVNLELPLGGYTVRIKMDRYKDFERAVKLDESREVLLMPELVPVAGDSNKAQAFFEKGKQLLESKNYAEAWEQFKQAASLGHPESQNEVGYMLMRGLGVKKDWKGADTWFRNAAAQGLAPSQNNLGIMYLRGGEGIKHDDRESFTWFQMAAMQGDPDGEFYLGNMYRYGRGTKQDLDEAARWYQKAANLGHEGAKKALKTLGK